MPRTNTTNQPSLSFPSSGTFSFPIPASRTSHTSYVLPPGSKFDSDLHWHESYTEYFRLAQGVVKLVLESPEGALETSYIGPRSGIIEVPKGRRHRLRRGDQGDGFQSWMASTEFREGGKIPSADWEAEVKGAEWTSPADGRKEAFFRNLSSAINDSKKGGKGIWKIWEELFVLMSAFAVSREFDNWPAFLGGRWRGVEWVVSHVLLGFVSWVGMLVGIKGEYEEYTPKELRLVGREGKKEL